MKFHRTVRSNITARNHNEEWTNSFTALLPTAAAQYPLEIRWHESLGWCDTAQLMVHPLRRFCEEMSMLEEKTGSSPPQVIGPRETLAKTGGDLPRYRSKPLAEFVSDPRAELDWFSPMPSCRQYHGTFEIACGILGIRHLIRVSRQQCPS
jgi:hypothetical protein